MKSIKLSIAAAAVLGGSAGAASAIDLTVISWGGAYSVSQINAYHEPYMAANPDVNFIYDESAYEAVAKLRAMDEANNLTWDLVDVIISDAIRLCDEGLVEVIDVDEILAPAPDGTPASTDFEPYLVSECFIPEIVYSTTFAYRTDVDEWEGRTPESACAVFDLENFPGQRALEKRPINNLEWALYCDGVALNEVYDVLSEDGGIDRALAKLDTIKDSVIWWSSGADTPQLLADGEIVLGSTYNGRLFNLIEEIGAPVAMLWDAQAFDFSGWVIPTGLSEERKQAVVDFLRFATDTQRLADQAKYIPYGPARASSQPLVSTHAELGIDMLPHMPTAPDNTQNVLIYDYLWWADYRDDVDQKFQAWLAQ